MASISQGLADPACVHAFHADALLATLVPRDNGDLRGPNPQHFGKESDALPVCGASNGRGRQADGNDRIARGSHGEPGGPWLYSDLEEDAPRDLLNE